MSLISQVARIPIHSPTAASTSHCERCPRLRIQASFPVHIASTNSHPSTQAARFLLGDSVATMTLSIGRLGRLSEWPLAESVQLRPPCLIPAFTRSPVRGLSVALRHSVFCFASLPFGFRFLPREIRAKTDTQRQANFFRFPPEKQSFGTWEPGPLPRLRHV